MSTHSTIGVKGFSRRCYINFDGGPAASLPMLRAFYNTIEKVDELLALGNLRTLGPSIETTEAYHRDCGEHLQFCKKELMQWNYYFYPETGTWDCF
jgi:hypothetical protein